MIAVLYLLLGCYALFNITLIIRWIWPAPLPSTPPSAEVGVAVIVPVRNEEQHIESLLRDLEGQHYPARLFEVIVANDGSTDQTAAKVCAMIGQVSYRLRLLQVENPDRIAPKKRAITQALQATQQSLIVCTDGDCRVPAGWLGAVVEKHLQSNAQFVSGMVSFHPPTSIIQHLLTVEFASLVGAGGMCMQMGFPNMCNGANMAFTKKAFEEVEGYAGVAHIASGDDEFLMHKIAAKYPQQVSFLKSPAALVSTAPPTDLPTFFNQRKRWASKWNHYQQKSITAMAIFIFAVNTAWLLCLAMAAAGYITNANFLILSGLKLIPEGIFLGLVLLHLRKTSSILWIPLTQLVYPFYVSLFGLVAQGKEFEWKGRKFGVNSSN